MAGYTRKISMSDNILVVEIYFALNTEGSRGEERRNPNSNNLEGKKAQEPTKNEMWLQGERRSLASSNRRDTIMSWRRRMRYYGSDKKA